MKTLTLAAAFLPLMLATGAGTAQQPLPSQPAFVPPPPFVPVNGDLRATILAANRSMIDVPQWTALLTEPPIAAVLDALVPLRTALPGYGEQQVRRVLAARKNDVAHVWRSEPQLRQERAPAFALCDLGWPTLFAAGEEAERLDVLAVAAWLRPEELEFAMRIDDAGVRPAAEQLARVAAEGQRQRGQPFREAIASGQWNHEVHLLLNVAREQLSAFAIVDGLSSPDAGTHARTLLALRRLRKLPLPEGLAGVLANDCVGPLRDLVGVMSPEHGGLLDSEVDAVIAAVRNKAPLPWDRLGNVHQVSQANRMRLVQALLDDLEVVQLAPELLRRGPSLSLVQRANLVPRAVIQVAVAAAMGREPFAFVLDRLATPEPRQRGALLAGLYHAWWTGFGLDAECAKVLTPLLGDRDEGLALGAATFAGSLLEHGRYPELVRLLGDRALAALAEGTELHFAVGEEPCMSVVTPSLGGPATPQATWVFLAAKAGDERLVEPLLARMPEPQDSSVWDGAMWFTCACLSKLVPTMDGATALRVHDKVLPLTKLQGRGARGAGLPQHVLWVRLFAAVPDQAVDSYATAAEALRASWTELADLEDRMPPARVRLILPERDPEALTAAWHQGGEPRQKAIGVLIGWWADSPGQVLRLCPKAALPIELAASALPSNVPLDLTQVAMLLPDADSARTAWSDAFANRVVQAEATREQELELLPKFAASRATLVARSAAQRAHRLGAAGISIVTSVLDRWAGEDASMFAAAASLAIELGVPPSDVQGLARRLEQEPATRVLAECLRVRFAGLSILDVPAAERARVASACGVDFDVATWREGLGEAAPGVLFAVLGGPNLGREGSPANALATLTLAAELPRWSEPTERAILHRTLDADPRVRLAAYRALHSRDRQVWAGAWLAYEAEFDLDADVRAFAATLPR